ncbi:MAG: HAMP domain-containing histidine kinase [Pedobacter sp.]|nr:HAMP domain-containing histidine kinase [Chitinophagaceae bacterium]
MNLKLRLALLFSFFVAIILLSSCLTICVLYKNYRVKDFKQRLINEGNTFYSDFNLVNASNSTPSNFVSQINSSNLINQHVALINNNYNVIYKQPNDTDFAYLKDTSLYSKIKINKLYAFNFNNREAIGLYFEKTNVYVIISAIDIIGLRKLKNLHYILWAVFCGALIITTITAFFFVEQAFKPLVKLSSQMEDTTEQNLTKQIDESNGYTEINMIARNFNAMLKRLNNAFQSQRTFVQNASHELRTPLATMLSQTEAALNRNLDIAGYKKVLLSLKEDQTDLIELTNSLLIISQYERLAASASWPPLRIDELLYDTIANCKRIFTGIDITLNFKTLPKDETELILRGNDALLKSALRNLVKNAYNYSNNKKVSIVMEIGSPFINIHFINTGQQLLQSEMDKIKMPFFRGNNALTKKGFGLGLSIVTTIVELHKGKLNYEAIGENTNQFTISLPV